jgi:hypothetical protein
MSDQEIKENLKDSTRPEDSDSGNEEARPTFEPLQAIGIFLAVFGVVILYATTVPKEFWDKVINFSSGIVLLAIGLFCFFLGLSRSRKARKTGKAEGVSEEARKD